MANTSSAKKADRASGRRAIYNARRKKAVKDAIKKFEKLVAAKKGKDAQITLAELYQAIDKAAKGKTIKKNTAGRMKSRAAKQLKALA